MFDIGWSEMLIVAAIALIVVGPKELPKVLRTLRAGVARARAMVRDFQSGVDELVREAELGEVRKDVESLAREELSGEFDDWSDPTGEFGDTPSIEDKAKDEPADKPKDKPVGGDAPGESDSSARETAVQSGLAAEGDAPAQPRPAPKAKPKAAKKKAKRGKPGTSAASNP